MEECHEEIFTVRKLRKQGRAPEVVVLAISALKREFREINRRTEVGSRWTDKGLEQVWRPRVRPGQTR